MRPKQWTKNIIFVFPAIVFDGKLFDIPSLLAVLYATALVCLIAGTVYILNDLVDIESDRQHPRKRHRPLPSGQLPIALARTVAVVLPVVTLSLALAFNWRLAVILAVYFAIQIAYSLRLKHVVIVDILTVTSGFVLRVAAGVVVIEVTNFSPWLYICTGLLALFLAIGKRRQELMLLGDKAASVRPIFQYYNLPLLDEMLRVVTTSTFIAYTLYTIETPSPILAQTNMALGTVPFVLYGLFRYLYLIYVKGEMAAPDEVLLKDRPLQIDIALFALSFIVIIYVIPG
ncbi:MAG: decaprenyl-phosphate phosphoribosyltransferase [Anaerolineae bacterium]|jgi:4-hydroxybenzoate polyprenyltransferase|nr:decaprenyl-phosphate phosphoribosyltransferase [Anaerolineae bacterium]